MKRFLLLAMVVTLSFSAFAQKPYDEKIDAVQQINAAVEQAQKENKFVLCQVGGNWCIWCLRFAELAQTNDSIKTIIDKNFVYIHVNFSKGNKNVEAMKMLRNPARFGFPVFVILDEQGNYLHTQNSAYLEENEGYSVKKVVDFLQHWTPKSLRELNLR